MLNGADVFAWNIDKAYLSVLPGVPVVPTLAADDLFDLRAGVERFGTAVVKPRIGAGGAGVIVVDDPDDPRLGVEFTDAHDMEALGPWVVQPLVASVRTEGETSVYVLGGQTVSQIDKLPVGDEIRVHEHYGGSSRPVPLRDEAAELAFDTFAAASGLLGRRLDYGRADMMRLADGRLAISELELVEPASTSTCFPTTPSPSRTSYSPRCADASLVDNEPPRVWCAPGFMRVGLGCGRGLSVVLGFGFGGVSAEAVHEAAGVVPVHPVGGE